MLQLATEAALEASRFLKMSVGKIKQIERKFGEETNLVTEIDKKSEEIIISKIKQRFPHHDILAEESGSHQKHSEYRWIIDPLDGTTNFTHGLPIFCVSIALEKEGELILGVVYDPNLDEIFTAEKGRGAYLNNRRLQVSSTSRLIDSMLVTGFPYSIGKNPEEAMRHFNDFLVRTQAVRRLGSAALDLCYVAAGRFDGFWEMSLHPWDMAAGVLIAQEAGATYTDFRGFPTTIDQPQLLVSNGFLHEQMVEVLKQGMA